MVKVNLSDTELDWCQGHAEEIVNYYAKKFGDKGSGAYNHNKVSSNLVGVKSELATKVWLNRNFDESDIQCNYEDFKNKKLVGDINIHGRSLEIKGLRPNHWNKFKRCVPPNQLNHYVRDDAIVIWTTASGDINNDEIQLKGWNYAHEIKDKGIFRRTICDNIWLEADEDMRNMESLLGVLKS